MANWGVRPHTLVEAASPSLWPWQRLMPCAAFALRRRSKARRSRLHAAPWDIFSSPEPVKLPYSTKEVLDALKASVEVLVKSGVPRADVDLPAGLRLGTENVMDPLIVPDVEPSAEQVLQADRELARIFVAMFKQALKKRLRIVFRTNKQAATAKRLWGKAAGEVRVLSMPGSSAQKGAFAEGEEPGAAFLQSMKASGDGFVVLVAPRRRQLEAIARAAEEVNSKTCFILLNARLRSAKKDALREELASAFAPAFHLRLVQQGEGLVYRAMQEGSSPWILARRKLPSTVATEVAQTMEEPSAERIAQVFA